jgi:hypothetical protein
MSGHLNEGMSLIQEFNKCPLLVSAVERLSQNCRCAHEQLCACLKGGSDSDYFGKTVSQLRHKTAFHYDAKTTRFAINYLADRPQPVPAKITMGGDAYLTRFNLADAVLEVALTRKVLEIKAGENVDEGLRPFAEFLNRKCIAFVLFVKSFVTTYLNPEWISRQ